VTAAQALRVAAVLDATGGTAERHACSLTGFLRDGLSLPSLRAVEATTLVFLTEETGRDVPLRLVPTRDVRVTKVPARRTDLVATALSAFEAGRHADLYVFPAGPAGIESASCLAARAGGSVITGVLSARLDDDSLTCRRTVYGGHLFADVAPGPRPWCLVLDPGRDDALVEPPTEHVITWETLLTADDLRAAPPLLELEPLEAPSTGDLEAARFLVVAGRGAGSSEGVARIAAAAERMGAAFGVTRPVAMNAWAGPDRQIGVSGTRTAPAVCIVAGASGAPAFVWGVERAGFIAAVDTDDHAPIAGEVDAFVAGDGVAVLEALAGLLASRAGRAPLSTARDHIGRLVEVEIDRPLGSLHPEHGFRYPVNYGSVLGVPAPDGDDLDAYVLEVAEPLERFTGRCIAVIHRLDDDDDKLVIVPDGVELSDSEVARLTRFQEQYFSSVIVRE
jgi:electron transfer flavoprotein alpha subunit